MLRRLAPLFLASWSVTAMAIESPPFELLQRFDDFEVRRYPAYVVAETEVSGERSEAGNAAFSILAGYIFGKNTASTKIAMTAPVTQSEKIAMTAPVTQQESGGKWKVAFSMPAKWTLETLPTPNDPRVTLRAVPEHTVAVVKYSGTWSSANYEQALEKLRKGLEREGLRAVGEPVWARYDPPWMPWFLRNNEIQQEVAFTP